MEVPVIQLDKVVLNYLLSASLILLGVNVNLVNRVVREFFLAQRPYVFLIMPKPEEFELRRPDVLLSLQVGRRCNENVYISV